MKYYITRQTIISDNKSIEVCNTDYVLQYFADKTDIQVDTETTGFFNFKNEILLLQLGDYENQFVFNFAELSLEDRGRINREIFLNPNKTKIFQNAKFDIKFLWLHGFDIVNVFDTMLAEILLSAGKNTPEGFYSLYGLAQRYCGVELDKSVRGAIHSYGFNTRVLEYAANDVKYLEEIKEKQLIRLKELGSANENHQDIYTVCGLEMNAVIVFASMEYNGIGIDVSRWKVIQQDVSNEVARVSKEIDEEIWNEPRLKKYRYIYQDLFTSAYNTTRVNWSSPKQKLEVLRILFPDIEDTSERILSRYKSKHSIVSKLLEYNKMKKLSTAFADKILGHINPVTGRIHTDFWQIRNTGRISSSKPNLQQIPSRTELGGRMRSAFVPARGNKMVGGDYFGCELRIIAEFSEDPVWINAFLEGKDLHSELCSLTFDIDIKDVKTPTPFKSDLKYRDVQKTLNFGLA